MNVKHAIKTITIAKGDGNTDDTKALQHVIDAVADAGGDRVEFPSGRFVISAPLVWSAPDVYLHGTGATTLVASQNFKGDALIRVGHASDTLDPTYRGGIYNLAVDLGLTKDPDLIGIQLIQTWFTTIRDVRILNPFGLSAARQTAFQISAGATSNSAILANWACHIHVDNLQIAGSFKTCLSHVSGVPSAPIKAQVNRVKYVGGCATGCGKDRPGTCGARFETGDTTRVYGFALENFETGCFVGTQNQGPIDFAMEQCATEFAFGFPELAKQAILAARSTV